MTTPSIVNNEKSLLEPTMQDLMLSLKQDIFKSLNCVKVGQIMLFDGAKKTAQVKLLFKRVVPATGTSDGTSIQDYPVLVDCPVFTLQGGGGAIQFPIAAGDQCLVLFADRNLDAWFQNGVAAAPFDARTHSLSDGIVLVGLNSLASNLATYPTDKVMISYGGTTLSLGASGIQWDGTGGAEIDLASGLVKIKNTTTTLLTLLNGLIDVLAATLVQGPSNYPLTAATIAALEAYKLQFASLLQ